jgi:hypothetical protein
MRPVYFPMPSRSRVPRFYFVSATQLKLLQAEFPPLDFPDLEVYPLVRSLADEYRSKPLDDIPTSADSYWAAIVDRVIKNRLRALTGSLQASRWGSRFVAGPVSDADSAN